jgi:hypothetical protein
MATFNDIQNLLNIDLTNHVLSDGRKKQNKNKYYIFDNHYIVSLSVDKWMIIDNNNQSRQLLKEYIWYNCNGYASTVVNKTTKYYHQLYMNYDKHLVCDHINRRKYDNRMVNIRIVSQRENLKNKGMYINNTSGHKGIHCNARYYISVINDNNGRKNRKYFSRAKHGDEEALKKAITQRLFSQNEYGYLGD